MHEERLIELETKYAHQEHAVEDLQRVTYEQHLVIERLTKDLKRLGDRLESLLNPDVGPSDQKPPHY